GPVVDDGYKDDAVKKLGEHKPAGPWRGGKYSNFEGGTRVPMIARWPGRIKQGESAALMCQIDFPATFAALVGRKEPFATGAAPDSVNTLAALLGESEAGRESLVEHAGTLALRHGDWKWIAAGKGAKVNANTNTELGNDPAGQLFNLKDDPGERQNLTGQQPAKARAMAALLEQIRAAGAAE
ncbi:MAG: sulfatase-like hydrolase/transferase, partial [Planctomycetales bacterium]|nr:sulfatase-like hydrolase/transferase [Planctomycetales bacterium]